MDESNPYATPHSETVPSTASPAPNLWNPDAAGAWSLMFTPVFGIFILGLVFALIMAGCATSFQPTIEKLPAEADQDTKKLIDSLKVSRVETLYYDVDNLPENLNKLIEEPSNIDDLGKAYKKGDPDELYRFNLILILNVKAASLSKADKESVGTVMLEALNDKSPWIRAEAVFVLGELRYKKAEPYVDIFLQNETDLNAAYEAARALSKFSGGTPFVVAAQYGRLDLVNKMLRERIDVKGEHKMEGYAALFSAAYKGKTDVIKALLDAGAHVNVEAPPAWTPLIIAAAEGHNKTVVVLIQGGADVNARNQYGRTALMFASKYGFTSIVKLLLEAGADPDIRPNDINDRTALISASEQGHLEVVQALLAHGADANIEIIYGYSPLSAVVEKGHTNIAEALLKAGADPNQKNTYGNTPFLLAISAKHTEIAKLMLEAGADPNSRVAISGFTALMTAAMSGDAEIMHVLLEKGADINAKSALGVTAIDIAKSEGHDKLVELLRQGGAAE